MYALNFLKNRRIFGHGLTGTYSPIQTRYGAECVDDNGDDDDAEVHEEHNEVDAE